MGNMPFVNLDWTLIFQWGNLLILYLVIKKFLFGPIQNIIESREKEVQNLYDTAEQAKNDAIALKEEYSQHLANAKDEANEILKTANKKATVRSEEIIREAQDKAAAIVAKADVQIEMERKHAFEEVKKDISDIALMAASKVVERELSAEEHERLIGEFIENVGEC